MNLFNTRNITFSEPIEMLYACHDKIRRFCQQISNLNAYLNQHGLTEMVSQNLQQISHYFNVAAPLHHLDEESDFFPLLRQYAPETGNEIAQLETQHQQLQQCWQELNNEFLNLAQQAHYIPDAEILNRFLTTYAHHLQQEEKLFEIGRQTIPKQALSHIGQSMAARRHV